MNSFLETLKQLGPTRLAIMGSILLGLLLFFVFVSMRVSAPSMKLLYDDLAANDSRAIVTRLDANQIPYEVSQDGSRVSVSSDDVGRARMLLAQEGLPNGGNLGYEIFDKQNGFGTTNFVQNINQVRALEGELARTIGSLDQIRNARVHLVLPQRELFSRESRTASGSVFLSLRPGAQLSAEQILAIQSLVASAVPQMKAETVAVIDSNGKLLAKGGEEPNANVPLKAEELRRAYEARMTGSIEDILGRIVGYGRVRANVTAELNFDRITTAEELFDPESAVVRSSQVTEENNLERTPADSNVSVQNNLPTVGSDSLLDQKPSLEGNKIEEVTNYEISKTIRNTVRETGEVKRLSVAVLVDGTYTTDAEGKKTYQPRSQEEVDRITTLVRSAIGYDEKRGDTVEVVNMQFADIMGDDTFVDENLLFGFEKSDLLQAVEVITVAVMIILVILLVLQPMVGRLLSTESPKLDDDLQTDLLAARPMNPQLTGPSGEDFSPEQLAEADDELIDMKSVEGKVKASSVKKVEDIVDSYPSETVSVIRSWMTQES